MEAVEEFLVENRDFVIDYEREKFFLTFNPKGFLKKISGDLEERVKLDGDMRKRVVQQAGLPPAESSVYYHNELQVYYPGVQFGINCAVANPAYVKIEPGVIMAHHSSMTAVTGYNGRYYRPTITVGEATQIGPYNAFAAIDRVTIGRCVLFAPYVHVSDHSHGYQDVSKPVMHQPVFSNGPVVIEDGCWLGFGSHILSGVTIGKNSVVGANSVVTENIPPYSVAVGSPAKIIKRFDFERKRWEEVQNPKVDHPGNDPSSPWDLLRSFFRKKMRRTP
jgi:acetyltransferase-like isoleucine patch superfamily enzyme